MAVNAFVSFFDKADGESIQKGKEKWIEIQGWDWEVEAEIELDQGRRRQRRQAEPGQAELRALLRHLVDGDPGLHLHRQGVPEGASCR